MKLLQILLVVIFSAACGSSSSSSNELIEDDNLGSHLDQNEGTNSNARLLFSEDFEGGASSPGWSEIYFQEPNYAAAEKFSFVEGRWAINYHLIGGPGAENEQTPVMLLKRDFSDWFGTSEVEEMYIEHMEYWNENYDSPTGSQKMLRIGRETPDDYVGPYLDSWNQIANRNLQIFHYFRDGPTSSTLETFNNTDRGLEKGRWVKFGNWVRLNTPGESDGFVRLYVDDQKIAALENQDLRGSSERGYNFFWLGGNATYWQPEITSGHPANPQLNCSRYLSGIKVYNTKP